MILLSTFPSPQIGRYTRKCSFSRAEVGLRSSCFLQLLHSKRSKEQKNRLTAHNFGPKKVRNTRGRTSEIPIFDHSLVHPQKLHWSTSVETTSWLAVERAWPKGCKGEVLCKGEDSGCKPWIMQESLVTMVFPLSLSVFVYYTWYIYIYKYIICIWYLLYIYIHMYIRPIDG